MTQVRISHQPEESTMEPFHQCPSFQRCSVNQGPLDPEMLRRPSHPSDRERKCRANRSTREAIAANYPADLPTGGLTLGEVARDKRREAARARFAAMTPKQRARRLSGMGRGFKKHHPPDSEGDFPTSPTSQGTARPTPRRFAAGPWKLAPDDGFRQPQAFHIDRARKQLELLAAGDRAEPHLEHATCRLLMALQAQLSFNSRCRHRRDRGLAERSGFR